MSARSSPVVRGFALALGFGLAWVVPVREARAAELAYAAPPACPDRAAMIEEIERLVGRPLASVRGVDFDVNVSARADGGFQAVVRTVAADRASGSATREVEGATCDQAAQAAAVVLAMASRTGDDDEESASEQAAQPAPMRAAPTLERRNARAATEAELPTRTVDRTKLDFGVGLAGVADVGALPSVAPGVALELVLGFRSARLIAQGAYLFPQERRIADGTGGRFELQLGALLACATRAFGGVSLAACAGLEAGALTAEGVGLRRPSEETVAWLAPRLEARPELDLGGGFRLVAGIGASVPLSRRRFVSNGAVLVHRPASLTGRGLFGVQLFF